MNMHSNNITHSQIKVFAFRMPHCDMQHVNIFMQVLAYEQRFSFSWVNCCRFALHSCTSPGKIRPFTTPLRELLFGTRSNLLVARLKNKYAHLTNNSISKHAEAGRPVRVLDDSWTRKCFTSEQMSHFLLASTSGMFEGLWAAGLHASVDFELCGWLVLCASLLFKSRSANCRSSG